jgi:nitrite reductase (NADH) small subunit
MPVAETDMKEFVTIARAVDVPFESGLTVQMKDQELAVFGMEGEFCVLDSRCPHRGGPLGAGVVEKGHVFCPMHGWEFDLRTGACLTNADRPVKSYAVRLQNGEIQIEI